MRWWLWCVPIPIPLNNDGISSVKNTGVKHQVLVSLLQNETLRFISYNGHITHTHTHTGNTKQAEIGAEEAMIPFPDGEFSRPECNEATILF